MTNPFDTLQGLQDYNELNGIGSSLKKLGRKVHKAAKKVTKAITPKPIYNAIQKVKKAVIASPVVQGVVTGVVSIYGTPAAGAAVKAAMVAINARNVVRAARAEKKEEAEIKKLEEEMTKARAEIDTISPEFGNMVDTMTAQGYTDQQILDTWAQSQTFRDTAKTKVAQDYVPQIEKQMVQSGYSPQMAKTVAPAVVDELVDEVIEKKIPNSTNYTPIIIGAAAAAVLLPMLLNKRR